MKFPVKLSRVKMKERRELKEWLTGLLPEEMSRNDVADELGFSRKTISTMLNPDQSGFGQGLTMLLYLRLVGALSDAPAASLGSSRLEALEEKADAALVGIADILDLLREAPGESEAGAQRGSPQ